MCQKLAFASRKIQAKLLYDGFKSLKSLSGEIIKKYDLSYSKNSQKSSEISFKLSIDNQSPTRNKLGQIYNKQQKQLQLISNKSLHQIDNIRQDLNSDGKFVKKNSFIDQLIQIDQKNQKQERFYNGFTKYENQIEEVQSLTSIKIEKVVTKYQEEIIKRQKYSNNPAIQEIDELLLSEQNQLYNSQISLDKMIQSQSIKSDNEIIYQIFVKLENDQLKENDFEDLHKRQKIQFILPLIKRIMYKLNDCKQSINNLQMQKQQSISLMVNINDKLNRQQLEFVISQIKPQNNNIIKQLLEILTKISYLYPKANNRLNEKQKQVNQTTKKESLVRNVIGRTNSGYLYLECSTKKSKQIKQKINQSSSYQIVRLQNIIDKNECTFKQLLKKNKQLQQKINQYQNCIKKLKTKYQQKQNYFIKEKYHRQFEYLKIFDQNQQLTVIITDQQKNIDQLNRKIQKIEKTFEERLEKLKREKEDRQYQLRYQKIVKEMEIIKQQNLERNQIYFKTFLTKYQQTVQKNTSLNLQNSQLMEMLRLNTKNQIQNVTDININDYHQKQQQHNRHVRSQSSNIFNKSGFSQWKFVSRVTHQQDK